MTPVAQSSDSTPSSTRRSPAAWAPLAAAVVAIGVVLANASPHLPGLHADGVQYLEEARTLAQGGVPRVPVGEWGSAEPSSGMVYHPPGFPLAMAAFIAVGARPDVAAVLVMALAAGATVWLAFLLGRELAGPPAGALAAALLVFTPTLVRLHTAVWSDPLYIALVLAAALALVRRPERSGVHGALALACTCVRHVGVSVAAAAALFALLRPGGVATRLRRAAGAGLPSLLFLVVWSALGADPGAPVRAARVQGGWGEWVAWAGGVREVLVGWLVPRAPDTATVALAALAALALTVAVARSPVWSRPAGGAYAPFALALAGFHLAVLALSWLLVDPAIPLNDRLIMPVLVLATVAVAGALADGWGAGFRLEARNAVVAAAVAAWLALGALQIRAGLDAIQQYGQFYTAAVWQRSPVLAWVRRHEEAGGALPYTNEPELLWLYTGRPAYRLPRRGVTAEDFERVFAARPAPIVFVNPIRPTDLPVSALPEGLGLRRVISGADGIVLMPES